MACAVDEEAKRTEGKKALAVESFARALRQVRLSSSNPPIDWLTSRNRFLQFWPTMLDTILRISSLNFVQLTTKANPNPVSVSLSSPFTVHSTDSYGG